MSDRRRDGEAPSPTGAGDDAQPPVRFVGSPREPCETVVARADLSFHILPASGTLLGVCVTLIGLVKIAEARIGPSRVDEDVAIVSLFFLAGAFTSYLSLRHSDRPRLSRACEKLADRLFLAGLLGLTAVAMLFAYEVI